MTDAQPFCARSGRCLVPHRLPRAACRLELYADLNRRQTLLLVEEWESREQFERNLDAAKLNIIVAAIELSSEAPVVRLNSVVREEGVQTLAHHRHGSGAARH